MNPLRKIEGRAHRLGLPNVDTDMIIPARHLKTISRAGLGAFAFEALRAKGGTTFDDPAFAGAPILVAGENFGCGSSREHAVWALADLGVRAVIAPSFSDIFAGNAFKNGVAAVTLGADAVERLLALPAETGITVDLEAQTVTADKHLFDFAMDPFRRQCLVEGLDEIGLTLSKEAAIAAYEAKAEMLQWTPGPPAAARGAA